MRLPIQQIDAFTDVAFRGNPAAVVTLDAWLPDDVMLAVAAENNLSETAFLLETGPQQYDLRWFTPTVEAALCGHATLAAAFALLEDSAHDRVAFSTKSGTLEVTRHARGLEMSFPAVPTLPGRVPAEVLDCLGAPPTESYPVRSVHNADYVLAVYDSVPDIIGLVPDVQRMGALRHNVICTAPGTGSVDFVSRFFAPASGVAEDPVTGSAHCTLAPFWSERLGRNPLDAAQLSARGGALQCEVQGDRVLLRGSCVRVLEGTLLL